MTLAGRLDNPPRAVMRLARRLGGQIVSARTRWDAERGGRVLELTVVWPGQTGYDRAEP